jgi:scyllo-inositol 2-dehydrogenase (NADP+)
MSDRRVAVVGYGLAGRYFHAPLVAATPGLEVSYVVTRSETRTRQVIAEHPNARVIARFGDLWQQPEPPELVVVATPNASHVELATAAIDHGIPVVLDKPMAPTADAAQALASHAEQQGTLLTVFQNRRWDTDQLTLRRLIADGALGSITRYESRFERWRPAAGDRWRDTTPPDEGGGVLLDLGAHLVDQALVLFGRATHVYAEISARRGTPADDDVFIALRHASGTISHLWASATAPSAGPRLRVQGTSAWFVVPGLDPQEDALHEGLRPGVAGAWGVPAAWERGRFVVGDVSTPVPPEPGDWPRFYALLRDALATGGSPPVDPGDAVEALRVLEAARRSATEAAFVTL